MTPSHERVKTVNIVICDQGDEIVYSEMSPDFRSQTLFTGIPLLP